MTTNRNENDARLPNDVARCGDSSCPNRDNCLRWIARRQGGARVAFADFGSIRHGDICANQIELDCRDSGVVTECYRRGSGLTVIERGRDHALNATLHVPDVGAKRGQEVT